MRAWRQVALAGLALAFALAPAPAAFAASPFANWAVIVVAGDWHAHDGGPSEAFDNARRDLAKAFIAEGFSSDNIDQFTARPPPASVAAAQSPTRHGRKTAAAKSEPTAESGVLESVPELILSELTRLAQRAPDGCLIYITSHGNPAGVQMGDRLVSPGDLGGMVDATCKDRPTVAVISSCFSGVFVPALNGPNRMVLTAARPDRSSFGCGQADRYTYFDGCILQSLPGAHDFAALATSARACVARKEAETGAAPPSDPQVDIGGQLRLMLPLYAFVSPGGTSLAATGGNIAP